MRIASALFLVILVGCKSAPEQPAATSPEPGTVTPEAPEAPEAEGPAAAPGETPEGQVACHLDCSGQERTTYGATEEESRAAAQQLVAETCRPEDGQYFIVCDK